MHNHSWGEDRVNYLYSEEKLESIPARWTDIGTPDPFVTQSAGRCVLHFQELLPLASLLKELKAQNFNIQKEQHINGVK